MREIKQVQLRFNDGTTHAFSLSIDEDKLFAVLAGSARKNKSHMAREADGGVVCRHLGEIPKAIPPVENH